MADNNLTTGSSTAAGVLGVAALLKCMLAFPPLVGCIHAGGPYQPTHCCKRMAAEWVTLKVTRGLHDQNP